MAVLRTVMAGSCDAAGVLHQVDVRLRAPIAGRAVLDRSGAAIPAKASREDVENHSAFVTP